MATVRTPRAAWIASDIMGRRPYHAEGGTPTWGTSVPMYSRRRWGECRRAELRGDPRVQPVHPACGRAIVGGQCAAPEIDRADHDQALLEARVGRQDEQVFGRLIADRQAPDGAHPA